jgi:hypothetical protein
MVDLQFPYPSGLGHAAEGEEISSVPVRWEIRRFRVRHLELCVVKLPPTAFWEINPAQWPPGFWETTLRFGEAWQATRNDGLPHRAA